MNCTKCGGDHLDGDHLGEGCIAYWKAVAEKERCRKELYRQAAKQYCHQWLSHAQPEIAMLKRQLAKKRKKK